MQFIVHTHPPLSKLDKDDTVGKSENNVLITYRFKVGMTTAQNNENDYIFPIQNLDQEKNVQLISLFYTLLYLAQNKFRICTVES